MVLALVMDAFIACFAYGTEKIRIPWRSAAVMGLVGTGALGASMLLSAQLTRFFPLEFCARAGSGVIFCIGLFSAFQNFLKTALGKRADTRRQLRFRWAGISFAVTVYLDETQADADHSKTLSLKEAAVLGCVLSLDSLGIGLGSGLYPHHYLFLLLFSLALHPLAVELAYFLGKKAAGRLPGYFSAFGGILLMLLAIFRWFQH